MAETRWWLYVQDVTHHAQGIDIAARAGIDNSHVTRWKKGQNPGGHFVVKFARAYERNVLEALVAAEYITEEEAALHEVRIGLDEFNTLQLIDEVRERVKHRR